MNKKSVLPAFLVLCFITCLAIVADMTGKWAGNINTPNGAIPINFTFKVDKTALTGSFEGPQGSIDLENGVMKGNDFSFDITGKSGQIHQTGKYYGDSVIINFVTATRNFHIKLLRAE
jgi:hypothetical protein